MASQKQQRLSDYLDAVHGGAFVGEHPSDADLPEGEDEPSSFPPAKSSSKDGQAPAKVTKGQMDDARKLLALALKLSSKNKES
jgi:hypothetical protein